MPRVVLGQQIVRRAVDHDDALLEEALRDVVSVAVELLVQAPGTCFPWAEDDEAASKPLLDGSKAGNSLLQITGDLWSHPVDELLAIRRSEALFGEVIA